MRSIAILGRQPAIGVAELESLYGAQTLTPINSQSIAIDMPVEEIDFARLGGSVKLGAIIATIPSADWKIVEEQLAKLIAAHTAEIDGKLKLGLSLYGLQVSLRNVFAASLRLKKELKSLGYSIRIIPNKELELNTAQVLHNKLLAKNGRELLITSDGDQTFIAVTAHIQDIEAYAARDQARPKRDARVGMLPPKLAQTLINLCNPAPKSIIFDPFCGTGVLLQEALIMKMNIRGSDLEPRMIEYTKTNLLWLQDQLQLDYDESYLDASLETADATAVNIPKSPTDMRIACETYLGRAFTQEPDQQTLNKVRQDVDTIHRKFLQNVTRQTEPGFRMCIAIPAWNIRGRFTHLNALDSLEELGYTRQSFVHASNKSLIYHREGQIVGRELVVLIRK